MKHTTLAEGFNKFRTLVLGEHLPPEAIATCEAAFFAGCLSYDGILFSSDGEDLIRIHEEAQAFATAKIKELDNLIGTKRQNN